MPELEQFLGQIESINSQGAGSLKDAALEIAQSAGVSNILILVFSREGALLSGQALGQVNRVNWVIAEEKARTVLATRRSTSVQRKRLAETGNTREDYGKELGSLITGGVAIYKAMDEDGMPTGFLGAIVASGAYPAEKDEEICVLALTGRFCYRCCSKTALMSILFSRALKHFNYFL